MRTTEAVQQLPAVLKVSNALTMTVPQSKGLEFDDVRCPGRSSAPPHMSPDAPRMLSQHFADRPQWCMRCTAGERWQSSQSKDQL